MDEEKASVKCEVVAGKYFLYKRGAIFPVFFGWVCRKENNTVVGTTRVLLRQCRRHRLPLWSWLTWRVCCDMSFPIFQLNCQVYVWMLLSESTLFAFNRVYQSVPSWTFFSQAVFSLLRLNRIYKKICNTKDNSQLFGKNLALLVPWNRTAKVEKVLYFPFL